ncbi:putative basic amino acid antiporter YfcC [Alkalimonas collagenimarina]|uniref:Basic amino acid antiporter YfcC n=1 Tax=Alkalimonas collagenimarina TaxID=400390 RepID=A0ABT9GV23_9GAMM|nr:putative basic amino acid antiporter YfcC [Alkalimonas collagenimarina]MDP4534881.1 putative basic amino acid antiporter YfcC [Alkalimonas collagenimarina]
MKTAGKNPVNMPDAFVILFFVMVFAAIASHLVPAGSFGMQDVVMEQNGETEVLQRIDPASFALDTEQSYGVPLFAEGGGIGFLNYAFEGLVSGDKWGSAIGVIAFILLTGGAFGIIMQTGAIHNGILALIDKTKNMEALFIPLMFVVFSLGGAIFGMGEEAIAFCIVLLPLMYALGYDAITTVLVTYVATQIGFAASWMNPFSIQIAQGIADIPLMSGAEFRYVLWAVLTLFGTAFTMRYARRIKENPELSFSYATDQVVKAQHGEGQPQTSNYTKLDSLILLAFFAGLIWIIWGVTNRGYYIPEIASQFFTIGLVVAVLGVLGGRLTLNGAADAFKNGAAELLPAALIVGMAKGIVLMLGGDDPQTPSVLNTMLYYSGQALGDFPAWLSAWFMLVLQSVFNFFVASGSGQAALTMPLIAPLADLVGISRQIAVLAFQLGDGLTNIIIPTSAALIGCLGVVRVDWTVWARFAWKLYLWLFFLASLAMLIAVSIGYQ